MKPKTLFELTGAPRPELRLERSILVIIDAQREYAPEGKLPLVGLAPATQAIARLLTRARQTGTPVVHVLHEGTPGGLFDPESESFRSLPGLEPRADETVIRKGFPDAFCGTPLARELTRIGEDRPLILAGFMTHMCITATASSALGLGKCTAVVRDAVATRDLRIPGDLDGGTVPAAQVNLTSFAALQDRISWVVESRDLLQDFAVHLV